MITSPGQVYPRGHRDAVIRHDTTRAVPERADARLRPKPGRPVGDSEAVRDSRGAEKLESSGW